jgi:hypothetical protein
VKILIEIDDDGVVDLAKKIVEALRSMAGVPPRSIEAAPLMTRAEYATARKYSVRTIEKLLPENAFVGSGRMRRVHVARADAALLAALDYGPADPIAALATANARKTTNGPR